MVKLLKLFLYSIFFVLSLVYFIPKDSLYFYMEHKLQKQKVIFSKEDIINDAFSLQLNHLKLYYDSIESASVENVDVKILGLYNKISIKNIELSTIASNFIPLHINNIDLKYTILNPLYILFNAKGEFGEASGGLSILDKNMTIIVKPSALMLKKYKNSMYELHKNSNGEYEYVQNF